MTTSTVLQDLTDLARRAGQMYQQMLNDQRPTNGDTLVGLDRIHAHFLASMEGATDEEWEMFDNCTALLRKCQEWMWDQEGVSHA